MLQKIWITISVLSVLLIFSCPSEETTGTPPPPQVNDPPYITKVLNNDGNTVQVVFSEAIDSKTIDSTKFSVKSGNNAATRNTVSNAWGYENTVYLTVNTPVIIGDTVGVTLNGAGAVVEAADTKLQSIQGETIESVKVVETAPKLLKVRAIPNSKVVFAYFSELLNYGGGITRNKFSLKSDVTPNPERLNPLASVVAPAIPADIDEYAHILDDLTNSYFEGQNGYILKLSLDKTLGNNDYVHLTLQADGFEDMRQVKNKGDSTGIQVQTQDIVLPTVKEIIPNDGKMIIVQFSEKLSTVPSLTNHERFKVLVNNNEISLLEGFSFDDSVYMVADSLVKVDDSIDVTLLSEGTADYFGNHASPNENIEQVTVVATAPKILDVITDSRITGDNFNIHVKFNEVIKSVDTAGLANDYKVFYDTKDNPDTSIEVVEVTLHDAYKYIVVFKLKDKLTKTLNANNINANNIKVSILSAGKILDSADTSVGAGTEYTVRNATL